MHHRSHNQGGLPPGGRGVCLQGEGGLPRGGGSWADPPRDTTDTTGYYGTHPTGMHSCFSLRLHFTYFVLGYYLCLFGP